MADFGSNIGNIIGTGFSVFEDVRKTRNEEKAKTRQFALALRRVAIDEATAKSNAEVEAANATTNFINNTQLFTLFKWMGLAVASSLVGLSVARIIKKRK